MKNLRPNFVDVSSQQHQSAVIDSESDGNGAAEVAALSAPVRARAIAEESHSFPLSRAPESSRSEQVIAVAVLLAAFFYLCLFRRATWADLDEGIILQGAQRILDGQVLYRDFFSFFTPGSYYFIALVFRIFGDSYVVAHTALAFIGAIFSPITYLLARRVCSRQPSLLVTALMTGTAVPMRFVVLHNWDSTLWACLALYCAVRYLETQSSRWGFAAASFTSLTVLFEQSKGAGLALGLGAGFLIIVLADQQWQLFNRSCLSAIAIGLAWPFIITLIYFGLHGALRTMLADWLWPLQHYSTANHVPYGYGNIPEETVDKIYHTGSLPMQFVTRLVFLPRTWIPFLPLFAPVLLIRLVIRRRREISNNPDWAYHVLVSATLCGLLLSVIIGRADYIHFFFLQPLFFLVLAWLIGGRNIRSRAFVKLAPILGFALCVSLLAMTAQPLVFSAMARADVVTRRGTVAMGSQDSVIPYVQAVVPAGEEMLIYPYGSAYYYLTQTYSPTHHEFFQPGMHTDQQLSEMLGEFSAHPTRFVLYEPGFSEHIHDAWPNTPASALVSDRMADYIAREYRPCTTLTTSNDWHFLFMARRDLSCPEPARSRF